ncbi:Lrp/AsnC family transcriptional regulator [Geomicrobium sp. JSM 1781026]|uniref:Lrp/AsnC family transcriptional regulator n=1 Tax=Geomicrobium sp. JSM 1781026 TaxID=3344580 RepID=UPI0035BF09E5
MKIDQHDAEIIKQLRINSRISLKELSECVSLSAPSVRERMKQLESFGVIKNYTVNVDFEALGKPVQCIVEATLLNRNYDAFQEMIKKQANVEFCYRIAGRACYMLKLHFPSFKDAEAWINRMSTWATTVTHFIFSEVHMDHSRIVHEE